MEPRVEFLELRPGLDGGTPVPPAPAAHGAAAMSMVGAHRVAGVGTTGKSAAQGLAWGRGSGILRARGCAVGSFHLLLCILGPGWHLTHLLFGKELGHKLCI